MRVSDNVITFFLFVVLPSLFIDFILLTLGINSKELLFISFALFTIIYFKLGGKSWMIN